MFSHPVSLLGWGAMKMAFEIPAELGRTGIANFGGNNGKSSLTSRDH